MAIKINCLDSFDKGFFGKTMSEWAQINKSRKISPNGSNLKMSSVDDLNKYFYDKMTYRNPKDLQVNDVFIKEEQVPFSDPLQDFFS